MTQDIANTDPNADQDKPFRPEARAPRGFADKRSQTIAVERRIINTVSAVYESHGFEALQTPAFEYADALGKFLPDSDRPNVGVFALQDDDDQWMALRYDLTAPLARFAAQNWETLAKPYRRYAFGPVWRNEKPGPGRLREFMQCDADIVGTDRPEADAEIIAMAVTGFGKLGIPVQLRINNRKLLNGLLAGLNIIDPTQQLGVLRAIDKFDRLGLQGVQELLGGGRLDESGDFTRGAGLTDKAIVAISGFIWAGMPDDDQTPAPRFRVLSDLGNVLAGSVEGEAGLWELSRINTALTSLGVPETAAIFDPKVVRGLEYYTGSVFEAELLLETRDEKGNPVSFGSVGTNAPPPKATPGPPPAMSTHLTPTLMLSSVCPSPEARNVLKPARSPRPASSAASGPRSIVVETPMSVPASRRLVGDCSAKFAMMPKIECWTTEPSV